MLLALIGALPSDVAEGQMCENVVTKAPLRQNSALGNAVGCNGGILVSIIDVGQGSSALITCPDKVTQLLIDSGDSDDNYPCANSLFLAALKERLGADQVIELAISTHPHSDHIFGFLSLIRETGESAIGIKKYIDNNSNNASESIEETIRMRIAETGGTYVDLSSTKMNVIDDLCPPAINNSTNEHPAKLQFLTLNKKERSLLECQHNLNDCSIVTKLTYQGKSVLFAADTTTRWEEIALNNSSLRSLLPSDILMVGHHGSESSSLEFLKAVNPSLAIISSGKSNIGSNSRYGCPRADVVDRIDSFFTNTTNFAQNEHRLPMVVAKIEANKITWHSEHLTPRLISTAQVGTIDFCLRDDSLYMRSDAHPYWEQHQRQ